MTNFSGWLFDTVDLMQRTDLFLGMHGAGMTNVYFLPEVRYNSPMFDCMSVLNASCWHLNARLLALEDCCGDLRNMDIKANKRYFGVALNHAVLSCWYDLRYRLRCRTRPWSRCCPTAGT